LSIFTFSPCVFEILWKIKSLSRIMSWNLSPMPSSIHFTFQSLIHFGLCVCVFVCLCVCVCVYFERFKGLISFFCMWMSSFPNISLRKHHLPSVYYWHVCQKPLGYKCRCISELFWCINLCVFILFWLLRLCSIFWSQ
jgi:hypothetical protein